LNCTLAVLEETLAVIGTVPETVAPGAGAVMEIVGVVDDDEFPFLPASALVRPTHPAHSNERKISE
jgi:hypothetical protein